MTHFNRFLLSSILLLTSIATSAQMGPPGGMGMAPPPEPSSDLVPSVIQTYKTVEGKELKVHIFNPKEHSADSNSPALLFFHGGGFRRGSPIQGYELSEIFNPLGVVVISVQYRLIEEGRTFDQIIADAKSSVRFIRNHAGHLGIDPQRIATSGHSAGAYLAYAGGAINQFNEEGEDTSVSSTANAMILWSMGATRSMGDNGELLPAGSTLDDFQPVKYVTDSMVPSIFIHGNVDDVINYEPTLAFQKTINEAGNQTSFHLVEGADHFFREPGQKAEVYQTMVSFLESIGFVES